MSALLQVSNLGKSFGGVKAVDGISFDVAPGGHMGVMLGAAAQGGVWKKSADWLTKRSFAKPAPTARRRATRAQ